MHSGVVGSASDFIAGALAEARGPGVLVLATPAPAAPLTAVVEALEDPLASVWRPPSGWAHAGVGAAVTIDAAGHDRCRRAREAADRLFARTRVVEHPAIEPRPARIVGGLAFAEGGAGAPPWEEFGDATFVLHRWTYERLGEEARLLLAVDLEAPEGPPVERLLREHAVIRRALEAGEGEPLLPAATLDRGEVPARDALQMPLPAWVRHIRRIQHALGKEGFEKLVAARRAVLRLADDGDPIAALARLASDYPECTGFLFKRGRAQFLGATPETLFDKRGREVFSQALAGSTLTGPDEATAARRSRQLASSAKNLGEHNVVVREIVRGLRAHCVRLDDPPAPAIIRIRSLLHLNTPIAGTLAPSVHPLDIVASLHPTPAVGGVPRDEAVRWITANENLTRGWYTGPVGWIDAHGDAEFRVAIRCGVLEPGVAHVYTGAGIVAASNPAAEYHETSLKQQPLLRALRARR